MAEHWKTVGMAGRFALAGLSKVRKDKQTKVEDQWRKFKDRLQRVPAREDIFLKGSWEDIARVTWELCAEDRNRMQGRLDEINLATMREVIALKEQLEQSKAAAKAKQVFSIEDVSHCEPLGYLSEEVRELVILIIRDKLREIENGHLPASLSKAIVVEADEAQWIRRCGELKGVADKLQREVNELEGEIRKLTAELKKSKVQELKQSKALKAAEKDLELLKESTSGDTVRLDRRLKEMERERTDVEQLQTTFCESSSMLLEELRTVQGEVRVLKLEVWSQEGQIAGSRAELADAESELKQARMEIARLKQEHQQQLKKLQQDALQLPSPSSHRSRRSTVRVFKEIQVEAPVDQVSSSPKTTTPQEMPIMPPRVLKTRKIFERLYKDATARDDRILQLRHDREQQKLADEKMGALICRQATEDSANTLERLMEEENARWHERRIVHRPIAWGQSRSTTPRSTTPSTQWGRGSPEPSMASTPAWPINTPRSSSPWPTNTGRSPSPVSPVALSKTM